MSRLTDLIGQLKKTNIQLASEIEREVKVLSSRREFGLNFERHKPEVIDLPLRKIRKGDKVRVLPERGSTKKPENKLWVVKKIINDKKNQKAELRTLPGQPKEDSCEFLDNLVVVAEFRDSIYPGLVSTGRVKNGGNKPFHTVINGENYHALKALSFTHKAKVDVIYIDPPYNSGAKDWKYNNNYVEKEDLYRHSKWLAFMERRLLIAKELLSPNKSILIVTIDEKEYLRLGLLLEQTFPDAKIQMISSVINPKGTGRLNEFSRTDEYIFFVLFGKVVIPNIGGDGKAAEVRWRYLRRTDVESARGTKKGGPSQFYPIYVDQKTNRIKKIGEPLDHGTDRNLSPDLKGCSKVFPIREDDGMEMNWGLTRPSLQKSLDSGYVRVSKNEGSELQPYIFSYLTSPKIKKVEEGELKKKGKREDGSWVILDPGGKSSRPTTSWNFKSHEAGANGTSLLRCLLPGRQFPFPKSLYAVEDCLNFFVAENSQAIVLDFFSGSGTTAHAVARLNQIDNGNRQCISITNNEVSAKEQSSLIKKGLRPGDEEWEKLGICEYITKPRIKAAVTGKTPDGAKINEDYKYGKKVSISDGLKENVEFFNLTYESLISVNHNLAFKRISPLLWMCSGSSGERIDKVPESGWEVVEKYGVLIDLDKSTVFCREVKKNKDLKCIFIVTNDERRFQSVVKKIPTNVEPIRLYESYLKNFQFMSGD